MQIMEYKPNIIEHTAEYHWLEDEMSKYKTLNHEKIKWEEVYRHSLLILENVTLDIKVCHYFMLASIAINTQEVFQKALEFFEALREVIEKTFGDKNQGDIPFQKNKIRRMIENFIIEFNEGDLIGTPQLREKFNEIFAHLGEILGGSFVKIKIMPLETPPMIQQERPLKKEFSNPLACDILSLNDRQYREFFISLVSNLLEQDWNNLNAYFLLSEAMWGRIKSLPPHVENITQVRYPDENLISLLLESYPTPLEHIKVFVSNLALNPFWFEGMKLFCERLCQYQKEEIAEALKQATNSFIMRFSEICYLKFDNGKPMCQEELQEYFKPKKVEEPNLIPKGKASKKVMKSDLTLKDIEDSNDGDSVFCSINSLMSMAKFFNQNGMGNNAKILYKQLKYLMETTYLKEYLLKEYQEIEKKL